MKVKLGDVCTRGSSNLMKKDIELLSGEYPIYGASGQIGTCDFYHQDKPYIAVVKDGAGIGRTMLLPEKSSVIGTLQYLIPNERVIPDYLFYVVDYMHLEKYYSGATIPHIYFKDYRNEQFTLHTLGKQKEIVTILNKLSTLISLRKQQLAKLDELVKARFVEMFGDLSDPANKWEKSRLSDVCATPDDIKCGPFGTQLGKDEYVENGIAVWEIPQINSRFQLPPTHYVTDEKAMILSAYSISSGDIAMSRKGNVGKCAVFPDGFPDGIIHSDVLRIRADKRIVNSFFLMQQLHDSRAVQHQIEMVSSGAIMAGINVKKLKHISIAVPPMEMQESFYRFSMKVNDSKTTIQHSLEKLETLKKALMQEYFG